MMSKTLLTAAAAVAISMGVPGVAAAQQATGGQATGGQATGAQATTQTAKAVGYREVEDDKIVVEKFNLTVDQIDDMNVYTPAGEKIGEVDEVLMDSTGTIVAVAVETGGFLGIGGKDVVVMLDQLTLEGDRFTTALSKEQLEALPRWDD